MACTYALLVGIDTYLPPVPPLQGCVADAQAMQNFLQSQVTDSSGELKLVMLLNEQASRKAIIEQFDQHLGQARAGDTALFYFCGHGSQAPTATEFMHLEPDGLDETLVCHDSRRDNVYDLADKELSALIAGVAHREAAVLVILDACHSGSGTRNLTPSSVRRLETDTRRRQISDYLVSEDEVRSMGASSGPAWAQLPTGRHIMLAACQADEEAMELPVDGQTRGVFSYHLINALHASNAQWTYRDLFNRVNSRVRACVHGQSPRIEANAAADLDQFLLGGAVQTAKFRAVIPSSPQARYGVRLEGDKEALGMIRKHLESAETPDSPRHSIKEVSSGETLTLQAVNGGLRIDRAGDDRPLAIVIDGQDEHSALRALDALEHVARWSRMLTLDNPATRLPAEAIQLEFHIVEAGSGDRLVDPASISSDLRLHYREHEGHWQKPAFRLKLTNRSRHRLYAVLLDLTDRFRISAQGLFAGGRVRLDPGEAVWANQGNPVPVSLPEEWWNQGLFEYRDVLKVIASTQEFDATRFEQGDLAISHVRPVTPASRSASITSLNAVEQAMSRALGHPIARDFADTSDNDAVLADWTSSELTITTVRPLRTLPLVEPGAPPLPLGNTVRIKGHPMLRARARLSTPPEATRDLLGGRPLPSWLRDDPTLVQPFSLTRNRGVDSGLSVLELDEVRNPAAVTPESPLSLEMDVTLAAGEHILAIVFDDANQLYLPCGVGRTSDGKLQLDIRNLPEPSVSARSLFGSIKIFFSKIISKAIGTDYEYPVLAQVKATEKRNSDPRHLRKAVSQATRIVVYVHGIIGDTETMAASAFHAVPGQTATPIGEHYDLVLAFDYENLSTRIEENARLLGQRLANIGLGANHDKEVHIVAHSMGGLVSRWFIEQEGGKHVVSHLVMLGTPNRGSPWSSVENWLAGAIGIGLNRLSTIVWPAKVLTGLLTAFEQSAGKSLDQMGIGSEFLEALENNDDPGVTYTVIAGNTSLIARALETSAEHPSSLFERLMARLNVKRVMHSGASLAFKGEPNDVAVSTAAILGVPSFNEFRSKTTVACDHMSYFIVDESLLALEQTLAAKST